MVKGHCLQALEIMHHHVNGCFDWLISGQQSVNPSREAIIILSGKYERFAFVHPVLVLVDRNKAGKAMSTNCFHETHVSTSR